MRLVTLLENNNWFTHISTPAAGENIYSVMFPEGTDRAEARDFWEHNAGERNPAPEFVFGFVEAVVETYLDLEDK